jgi:hypothetical protein
MAQIDADDDAPERATSPLEVVERMAHDNNWPSESAGEEEIILIIEGSMTNYRISYTWMSEIETLHLACLLEIKAPALRLPEVHQLILAINEQLWVGHFDAWQETGSIMYRSSIMLAGGATVSENQCGALLGYALDVCDLYFPAFNFIVWAGKSAKEAMELVSFETQGEA